MTHSNKNTEKRIIVSFHIGRGGRFNNANHKSYMGELNFQQLISHQSNNCFEQNRDEYGRFCKAHIVDCSGNTVSEDDVNGEIGTLDFDGIFDTDIAKYIEECSDFELELIAKSDQYKSQELIDWMNANSEWAIDTYGNLVTEELLENE